ncbi:MAG: Na+/H+ antiporter NhaC [Bacteroidales bacterium]|nr:Na+/H+ antiporter NhaC [Bacteroidales bacterium]
MYNKDKKPALLVAVLPIIVLVLLLSISIIILDCDPLSGPSQVSLLLAALFTALLAKLHGKKWDNLMDGVVKTVSASTTAILILFSIGMIAGSWMIGGVIPNFIYYGLSILRAEYFLPATLVISAIISVCTGSSWTTIATIGVALLGMGNALGINPAITAGALISGAYFGDKVSPLSDTTNLAASACNVDLMTHIKFLMRSSAPAFVITLIIFSLISLFGSSSAADMSEIQAIQEALKTNINITPWVFIVPAAVGYMIYKKMPVLAILVIASFLGLGCALIFQHDVLVGIAGSEGNIMDVLMRSLYGTSEIKVGEPSLDSLLTTRGMAGMLNTVWLVLMAMTFGGMMESAGFMNRITEAMISKIQKTSSLVTATVLNCLLLNIVVADQFLTIVLSGKMFSKAYENHGLTPEMLSRTIEDSGTVTSVLVPWNSCGATQASVLGVATMSYLPYAFFCWISPLMSIFLVVTGLSVRKIKKS